MREQPAPKNPFRELDELKNRLPFLWELQTSRPRDREEGAAVVEQIYSRVLPKPAA